MTKINPCLKRTFTFFNFLFAIVGGVIVALAMLSQALYYSHGGQEFEGRTTGLIMMYVLGSVTMVIAILGAYGAHKESKVSLIVFLVTMVIGSFLMLRIGVPLAATRPRLEGLLEEKFHESLPLNRASDDVKALADSLQSTFHCCGLFSFEDWQNDVPDSCSCDPDKMEGACLKVQYRNIFRTQVKSIYAQTCFPIIWHYFALGVDIILGVVFFLASMALLGLLLSSIMIHQMRNVYRQTMVLTIPTIFNPQPPKYQELYNTPEY